jgi:integrase
VDALGRVEILRSLRTKDPEQAKVLHAQVTVEVAEEWVRVRKLMEFAAHSAPPSSEQTVPKLELVSLSHKDVHALAGEIYRVFIAENDDDPGEPEDWDRLLARIEAAMPDRYGPGSSVGEGERGRSQLPAGFVAIKLFGPKVTEFLTSRGLALNTESFSKVCTVVAMAMRDAAHRLKRNATGDYTTDPAANRFPVSAKFEPRPLVANHGPVSLDFFLEKWEEQTVVARSTRQSWVGKLKNLMAFSGKSDVAAITQDDVIAWRDHRRKTGVSPKTISMGDLAGTRSMFNWAVGAPEMKAITVNPVLGVSQDYAEPLQTREKGYRLDEAEKILLATKTHFPNLSEASAGARRWMPWLMAFSGARAAEIGQLHSDNVFQEATPRRTHVWCINLTPEDGTIKGRKYRKVPLHPQVLEQGFLEYVAKRRGKPLFYDPELARKSGTHHRQADKVGERVAAWVRDLEIDEALQPNHAWRHRFETLGRGLQLREDIVNYITGHKTDGVAAKYGDYLILALQLAIGHFPNYFQLQEKLDVEDDEFVNGISIFAKPDSRG